MGFKRIKKTLDNGLAHGKAAFEAAAPGGSNAAAQAQLPKGGSASDTPMLDKAAGSVNIGYGANELEQAADTGSYTDKQMKGGGGVDAKVDAGADHEGGKQHGGSLKLGERQVTPEGKKKAVLIGNADYLSADVTDLPSVPEDVATMSGSLSGYEVSTAADQTRSGIASAMSGSMDGLGRGDHLVLYYAGHGLPEGLIGVEVDPANAAAATLGVGEVAALVNQARTAGFHLTAVLDSCHAGSVADAVRNDAIAKLVASPELPAPARAVLGAAKTLEGAQQRLREHQGAPGGKAHGEDRGFARPGEDLRLEADADLANIWSTASGAAATIAVHVPDSKVGGLLPDKPAWLAAPSDGARMDILDRMSNQALDEAQGLMPQS